MDFEQRKKDLKSIALNTKSNGGVLYTLINSDNLQTVISKITDVKTKTGTNCLELTKKGYLTGNEQFVDVLCEFVYFFERNFAPLCHKESFIQMLFEEKAPKFLLCKNYWGDGEFNEYFSYSIKMFCIENMYRGIQFVYDSDICHEFFKKHQINKHMNVKNGTHIERLFNFMKDVVWCNYDEYGLEVVFSNYKIILQERINDCKKYHKYTEEEATKILYNHIELQWSKLIYNYEHKINAVREMR